jgi:hypothetical protein
MRATRGLTCQELWPTGVTRLSNSAHRRLCCTTSSEISSMIPANSSTEASPRVTRSRRILQGSCRVNPRLRAMSAAILGSRGATANSSKIHQYTWTISEGYVHDKRGRSPSFSSSPLCAPRRSVVFYTPTTGTPSRGTAASGVAVLLHRSPVAVASIRTYPEGSGVVAVSERSARCRRSAYCETDRSRPPATTNICRSMSAPCMSAMSEGV